MPLTNTFPDQRRLGAKGLNVQTLTAALTLTGSSLAAQLLTASGANRNVVLPTPGGATESLFFYIQNAGASNNITVNTSLVTLAPGQACVVASDGTSWYVVMPPSMGASAGALLANGSVPGTALQFLAALATTPRLSSADTITVVATDSVVVANSSGAAQTVDLPASTGGGRLVTVANLNTYSGNAVTVAPNGGDQIGNGSQYTQVPYLGAITYQDSTAGTWVVVSGGAVASATLLGALPAISGAALTNLPASGWPVASTIQTISNTTADLGAGVSHVRFDSSEANAICNLPAATGSGRRITAICIAGGEYDCIVVCAGSVFNGPTGIDQPSLVSAASPGQAGIELIDAAPSSWDWWAAGTW